MAAILRVKRKNADIPQDTLMIACKRPRTEASSADASTVQTVLQFAGTLTDPTEDVTKHMAKILPKMDTENLRTGIKRVLDNSYSTNISGKIPKYTEMDSARYKVTDCQRSLDTSNLEEFKDKWMTLIDVEDSWSTFRPADQIAEEKENIEDYVYDLYYAQNCDNMWFESDNILVVRPEYADMDTEDEEESSNSNSESNWRNDYPDTDPDRSKDSDSESESYVDAYDYDDDNGCETDEDASGHTFAEYMRKRQEVGSITLSNSSDGEENLSDNEERSSDNEERLTDDEDIIT